MRMINEAWLSVFLNKFLLNIYLLKKRLPSVLVISPRPDECLTRNSVAFLATLCQSSVGLPSRCSILRRLPSACDRNGPPS